MKLTVVKCGGAALTRGPFVLERYVDAGQDACVVHGAGARITAALAAAGIDSRFVDGRRVTTSEALPLVRESYRFENDRLCEQIGVRALGLDLPRAGVAQVSMNIEDWEAAALHEIVARIDTEAQARGAEVLGSELVGLLPAGAAAAAAGAALRIDGFDASRVLELRLVDTDP